MATMYNTEMRAGNQGIFITIEQKIDGEWKQVACFDERGPAFYLLTGFKSVDAFNINQAEKPVSFIMWGRPD